MTETTTDCSSTLPVGKKKKVVKEIFLRVRNDSTKDKTTAVNFTFLTEWLGECAGAVVDAIELFCRNKSSSTPVYNIRKVLIFWNTFQLSSDLPIFLDLESKLLESQVSSLRYAFFEAETRAGKALTTTYTRWTTFLNFLELLSERKTIAAIRINSPSLIPPPMHNVRVERENAVGVLKSLGPKSLDHDKDSYNEELFEPLSIARSDSDYIAEYTERLGSVLEMIKECALKDFNMLKDKRSQYKALIGEACVEQLCRLKAPCGRRNYIDPANNLHILKSDSKHPKVLANLLYVVATEMDGIPKPHFKYSANGVCASVSDNPHWHYISLYGKNKLLPYLGLMDGFALGACLVLLLLELPRVNATSLMRAKLEDSNGRAILLSSSGEDDDLTITVNKPRAGEEKSMRMSSLAREVMMFVLEWTRPIREEMIRLGQVEEAKWLWVGINQCNYKLINYSQKSAFNSLRLDGKHHSRGTIYNTSRSEAFLERHPTLKPWASKITFKALRLNVGVLEYLRTDGDLVATARVFGHKKIETTIGNYIPKPLRLAMYERQIRRHQNRLIISSVQGEHAMLHNSDFTSLEELHLFLKSQPMIVLSAEQYLADSGPVKIIPELGMKSKRKVVLYESPDSLAIAMLYQQHLEKAPPGYIDTPDRATGVAPRFWIDFVNALRAPLPLAMANITAIVDEAVRRMPILNSKVSFPRFEL